MVIFSFVGVFEVFEVFMGIIPYIPYAAFSSIDESALVMKCTIYALSTIRRLSGIASINPPDLYLFTSQLT